MSDDERDIESDGDGQADKRAHHNALERKRRDHIKDSFSSLRDSIPSLNGEKVQASRAQILKKAAEYISSMRRKNTSHQQDIEDLRKQNKVLEEQIRALEKAKTGGFPTSILEKVQQQPQVQQPKSDSISSLEEGISDSEGQMMDGEATSDTGDNNLYLEQEEEEEEPAPPASKRLKPSDMKTVWG